MKVKSKQKERKELLANSGLFAACLLFGAITFSFFSPVVFTNADEKGALASASVEAVISIAADDSATLNFTPNTDGSWDSDSIDVYVTTNSTAGYKLTVSSVDEETKMTSETTSDVIKSEFTGGVTSTTMPVNSWGYSKDNSTYYKIPPLSAPAVLVDTTTSAKDTPIKTTVYVGGKVNTAIDAGTYKKNIEFSAVAYEPKPTNIFGIENMQDMTKALCDATTTPAKTATTFDWDGSHNGDTNYVPRVKLKDTRDGNYYLVSKLADGNCWMSQSLALDLTANKAIEASKTDGTTVSVTPNNTTQTTTGTAWAQADNNWRSYHPQASEFYYKAGTTKSSTPTGSGDEYLWEKAGNYYNWYAATAGTGTSSMTSSDATASICPKGWRLPMNSGTKSFINLTSTTYGLGSNAAGSTALRANPLNFNLSGLYYYSNAAMGGQGSHGYYWSSTAYSSATYAYHLHFDTSNIYPQYGSNKGYGFSVRCVAL